MLRFCICHPPRRPPRQERTTGGWSGAAGSRDSATSSSTFFAMSDLRKARRQSSSSARSRTSRNRARVSSDPLKSQSCKNCRSVGRMDEIRIPSRCFARLQGQQRNPVVLKGVRMEPKPKSSSDLCSLCDLLFKSLILSSRSLNSVPVPMSRPSPDVPSQSSSPRPQGAPLSPWPAAWSRRMSTVSGAGPTFHPTTCNSMRGARVSMPM